MGIFPFFSPVELRFRANPMVWWRVIDPGHTHGAAREAMKPERGL
jgi:hypothetical protein